MQINKIILALWVLTVFNHAISASKEDEIPIYKLGVAVTGACAYLPIGNARNACGKGQAFLFGPKYGMTELLGKVKFSEWSPNTEASLERMLDKNVKLKQIKSAVIIPDYCPKMGRGVIFYDQDRQEVYSQDYYGSLDIKGHVQSYPNPRRNLIRPPRIYDGLNKVEEYTSYPFGIGRYLKGTLNYQEDGSYTQQTTATHKLVWVTKISLAGITAGLIFKKFLEK